jgi:hypothetical protein
MTPSEGREVKKKRRTDLKCECQHYKSDHIGRVIPKKGMRLTACITCECERYKVRLWQ